MRDVSLLASFISTRPKLESFERRELYQIGLGAFSLLIIDVAVLDALRTQAEQGKGSKPVSSTLLWPLCQLLL